jgi:type IV secretion system protein VirD4
MQLPRDDALVLVSGLAPIRAKKLRYYEDGNFTRRVAAPPTLGDGGYVDRPPQRGDDWGGQVRGPHAGLAGAVDAEALLDEEGGLQHQRHPGLSEDATVRPSGDDVELGLGLGEDDGDVAADRAAMARAQANAPVAQARAINEGAGRGDDDLLPLF